MKGIILAGGRGTRLCKDLLGPGKDKTEFLIFDHWSNFWFFEEKYKETQPSVQKSLLTKLVIASALMIALGYPGEITTDTGPRLLWGTLSTIPSLQGSLRQQLGAVEARR